MNNKFVKNQLVAKVIDIMGIKTVAFNFKVIKTNPVIRISEHGSSESSCLEFDSDGEEINGLNCSYLVNQETALKMVESGIVSLDGGEEEAFLDLSLEYWLNNPEKDYLNVG